MSCTIRMMLFQINVMFRFFSNHQRQDQMIKMPLLLALLLSKWGTHPYLQILLGEQVVSGSWASGCFRFYIFKVLLVKGKISFGMFSVKCLNAPLTFPLRIRFVNFKEIFSMLISFSLIFILSWIAFPSCNKLLIFPSSHNFKRLSSDIKWFFEFLLGICSNNVDIRCITLSASVSNGESWIQSFKRRVISSI